eukprot:TRINITY_DN5071_c0_g1_i1.p1 TRINITY_DN5071_c0_g1~~TRINITY_DN5071_c0_g1_i1.p1  ORF type:complete len:860 (-),score=219.67 TRINITY_DN5071_c0_g1_i1:867-3155(-)
MLHVSFECELANDMAGFYRSKYIVDGEERWMATTQFEATDARKAFPCWDEPAVKAIFEITLVVPTNRVALSNMDPVAEAPFGEGKKKIAFAPSPIMSTYLVAFIVGEFDYVESSTKEGVRVRIYTPVGKKDTGRFALDVGTKTLSYFTDYFGIAYPLPKCDMVAIADFSAGAMENWGLITYREVALLIDETSTIQQKQRVAYVVAHELAHQWFGNLVTMEWWSQLWLNEGFATFVGNLATNHLFPEWDIWTLFVNDYLFSALSLDGLRSSHPIEVDVRSSSQISEIFDAISYNKGSCVIRMLETYLGEQSFKQGLHVYLKRHTYGNAVTEDLWAALAETSGKDVKGFMGTFTSAMGYPVVSVRPGAQDGTLEVQQTRFLSNGDKDDSGTVWSVSLEVRSEAGATNAIFNSASGQIQVPNGVYKKDKWLKVNAGQSGFYRVKYSEDMLAKLLSPLRELALPPVDRLGILGDSFALSRAGSMQTSQALDIAYSLANEVDFTVWTSLSNNLGGLASLWRAQPEFPSIQKFVCATLAQIYAKLGWDAKSGEPALDTMLRATILARLGTNGHAEVIKEAQARFAKYLSDPSTLAADLKPVVFEIVMYNGTQETQDTLIKLYKQAASSEEKTQILRVLAFHPDPAIIKRAFEFNLTPEVREQDLHLAFVKVGATVHGAEVGWKFLQDNFDSYNSRLKGGHIFPRIIGMATETFTDEAKAQEIEAFFASHSVPAAERTLKQSLETIRARTAWLARSKEDVVQWLKTKGF